MYFGFLLGIIKEYQKVGFLYLFVIVWSIKKLICDLFFAKGIWLGKFQTKSGSWAIITGASEGIGRKYMFLLLNNDCSYHGFFDKLEKLSQEIESTYSTKVIVHIMDFSKSSDKDYEILQEIIQDLDIKVLVNNVGLSHQIPTPFSLTSSREMSDIIMINCMATLKMTKLVIPSMIRRKSGLILTMGSFSGITPTPLLATYSGSKAFLVSWSQALAEELKSDGIIVQLLNSYFVVSSMSKIKRSSFFVPTPKIFVKNALKSIGLQRGASTPYTMTPYPSHSILNWLLENKNELDQYDLRYYDSYAHYGIHEEMLKDEIRTLSYRDAIYQNKHLFQDKIVLDVGCGTGILSMFAAKAGAKLVIGIDMSDIIHQAEEIIKINGFSDKILLIKGRMEDIVLPVDKVDIIVSEWMGYFLLYESMLEAVIVARDAYLKEGGLMFPNKATMFIAVWNDVYGFDFTPIQKLAMREPLVDIVELRAVVTDPYRLLILDLYDAKKEDLSFTKTWELKSRRKDYIHAMIAWFDIEFGACHKPVRFSTGPHAKYTHWKQTVFYLNDVIPVDVEGETIYGTITNVPNEKNRRDLDITIKYVFNGSGRSINVMRLSKKKPGTMRSAISDVVTRDYTIHLHKRIFGCSFKKRVPRAIKCIREFAMFHMGTKDVRIDPQLNKEMFKRGIKNVPHRLRLRLSRKRNNEENAKESLYTYVQHVSVPNRAKGLQTTVVEEAY
ncbi:hypothetical protein PORY_000871 [Pneumocystis oryctolagi]|uniref:Uncharacterized protein n=1 Tax=Pneumocystis oryctolagi TaxID=42067 RepID=A0ACB7CE73_9ASCO|nr:hypothetical protein PORY_000871 [Pneumocystis oryctolagi]